jgi:hypothetical protein
MRSAEKMLALNMFHAFRLLHRWPAGLVRAKTVPKTSEADTTRCQQGFVFASFPGLFLPNSKVHNNLSESFDTCKNVGCDGLARFN